jgi:hydroxymethylglutaryl-CoA lyase
MGARSRQRAGVAVYPARVTLYEVGPRDGLQNEAVRLPVEAKVRLVSALATSGLKRIELGSFVRPDWIPQLADTDLVARQAPKLPGVRYSALVPNRTGLERAIASGLEEIAVFMSATESHNRKNTNKSVAQSLQHFREIVPAAREAGLTVRAYLSTVWGCPYEGQVDPQRALEIARQLREMGCAEISLGDTVGVGNPLQTRRILELFLKDFPPDRIALHLHDTNGTALANCLVGLELGITIFDTSIGGTGGCPYAPGAAGNLATEDLASMCADMGIETGIDLAKLIEAGALAQELIGHKLTGRRLQAALGRRKPGEARPAAST